jgi:hypothetical protein
MRPAVRGRRARAIGTGLAACLVGATVLGFGARAANPAPQATISGTLSVLQEDDFERDRTRRIHRIHDPATGKSYRLDFAVAPDPRLVSGSRVVVRGRLREDSIAVEDGVEVVEWAAAPATGTRSALVLIADFQDAVVPCSDAFVQDRMFTGAFSVDGLYREMSFGLVSFPGDTDGDGQPDVFRVSIGARTTDPCSAGSWAGQANQAADDAGIDRSLYQHTVYVLPGNTCAWSGLADVGCSQNCTALLQSCGLQDLYAHELGHNLGMSHASTDLDNDGQIDSTYGDWSDVMGLSGVGWRQVNGPHKEQMGWLSPAQILAVTPTGTQDFVISALETDPTTAAHPQLLKIFRPDRGDHYYVSYRRTTGYDATLRPEYADRTNVHRYPGSGNTTFIAALDDGQNLADDSDGLTITQLAHDDESATIRLSSCGPGSTDTDGDGTPDCPAPPLAPENVFVDSMWLLRSCTGSSASPPIRLVGISGMTGVGHRSERIGAERLLRDLEQFVLLEPDVGLQQIPETTEVGSGSATVRCEEGPKGRVFITQASCQSSLALVLEHRADQGLFDMKMRFELGLELHLRSGPHLGGRESLLARCSLFRLPSQHETVVMIS